MLCRTRVARRFLVLHSALRPRGHARLVRSVEPEHQLRFSSRQDAAIVPAVEACPGALAGFPAGCPLQCQNETHATFDVAGGDGAAHLGQVGPGNEQFPAQPSGARRAQSRCAATARRRALASRPAPARAARSAPNRGSRPPRSARRNPPPAAYPGSRPRDSGPVAAPARSSNQFSRGM